MSCIVEGVCACVCVCPCEWVSEWVCVKKDISYQFSNWHGCVDVLVGSCRRRVVSHSPRSLTFSLRVAPAAYGTILRPFCLTTQPGRSTARQPTSSLWKRCLCCVSHPQLSANSRPSIDWAVPRPATQPSATKTRVHRRATAQSKFLWHCHEKWALVNVRAMSRSLSLHQALVTVFWWPRCQRTRCHHQPVVIRRRKHPVAVCYENHPVAIRYQRFQESGRSMTVRSTCAVHRACTTCACHTLFETDLKKRPRSVLLLLLLISFDQISCQHLRRLPSRIVRQASGDSLV